MKIDVSGLNSKQVTLDVPDVYSGRKKEMVENFSRIAAGDSAESSYRCTDKLSLDLHKSEVLAQRFRKDFKRLFVLGTGGSSLGSKALYTAVKAKCDRELIFIENLDASDMPLKFSKEDFAQSGIIAISKSGNTLETLLALAHFEKQYTKHELAIQKHFTIVSDKGSKNSLTEWASAHKIEALTMDPKLGGRWSVTSTVGAFPLVFAGFNFKEFYSAIEKSFTRIPDEQTVNFAARLCDLDDANFLLHSLWVYSSPLKEVGAWWRQLWSESLGKSSDGTTRGAFALPCVGAVDQHSVLQQLAEGHASSYSGFIFVEKNASDLKAGDFAPAIGAKFSFLEGRSWTEIVKAQGRATLQSLQEKGRPTYTIHLDEISETSLGELMAFWMDVIALCGAGLKVNPFNQPGVERAKNIFPTLFG